MIYNYKTLPGALIKNLPTAKRRRGNPGQRGEKRVYVDAVCAFDIETTKLDEEHSIMWHWQCQIGADITVVGRSWREFKYLLWKLKKLRPEGEYFVLWVHNLAFEFAYLAGIYKFAADEVFLTDARKPLRADMYGAFEFRCSYRHSNMSLGQYLSKMGVSTQKLEMDYSVTRYPWTPVTEDELAYCIADVKGLVEALTKEMKLDEDSLYTIPLTSTGYCRRLAKKALRHTPAGYIKNQLPGMELFEMLRIAFRGGNTHASRFWAGTVIHDVVSYDRSSAYPDALINGLFPVTPFEFVEDPTFDIVSDLIRRRRKAVVMTIRMWGVRLSDDLWGFPYLSTDKCSYRNPKWIEELGICYDNGRILRADFVQTTCTDIDLGIILSEYDFDDIEVDKAAFARYGELPPDFKRLIIADYKYKTELKTGAPDETAEERADREALYTKRKNRLNSYYGMTAQSPVRRQYQLIDGIYVDDCRVCPRRRPKGKCRFFDSCKVPKFSAAAQIAEYQERGWLPYQWGCYTTAIGRLRLEEGLRLAGHGAVYCDTDSVKYKGEVDWSAYNAERIAASSANGAWADDPSGKRHYMGVFEWDGYYPRFSTLGSKKYVYEDEDGHLKATISGVNKKLGGRELEAAGGFSAFLTPGFTFYAAGGRELRYLDKEDSPVMIDGHRVRRRPGITINDSTYTLGMTPEYERLLMEEDLVADFLAEKYGNFSEKV